MKRLFSQFAILLALAGPLAGPWIYAQGPSISLTGSINVPGSAAILGFTNVSMTSDANLTLTAPQWAANYLKITSTVSLTSTRNIVAPLNAGQQFTVTNATTGARSIQIIGASGTGVLVPNGATLIVYSDGTNYAGASSVGSGTVTGPLQVPNLSTVINTPSSQSPFTVQANDVFDTNTSYFSDGTPYNTAGANYAASGNFIADQMFACLPNPGKCSDTFLLNLLSKYVAAVNGSGQMPINLSSSLVPLYYSAFDLHHAFASGDGTIFAPQMLYLYCQKFGVGSPQCSTAYNASVAVIKSSWAALPRNGSTHLFTVVAGNEYPCTTGFQEYVRNTGDVSNCNVWYASDMADMAAIATAVGDGTNAAFFNSEHSTVVTAIRANLINGTTGLLISATLQNSNSDDIPTSSLAVACDLIPTVMAPCGVLTSGQKTTIENYFNTNYTSLVNGNGYVIQTNRSGGWQFFGCIQAGGGGPYSSGCPGFTGTQYQGGNWAYFSEWFAIALGQVNPAKVATFLNTNLNPVSGDPAMEWNDQGSTSLPGSASTNYMASVQWAVAANNAFPLGPVYTAGAGCINKYGALTTATGCGAGLIYGTNSIATASTPVVFDGGSTNLELFQMKSSNSTGSRFKLDNGANGFWFLNTGSAFGAYAGSACFQVGPTTGPSAMQCWQNLSPTTGLVSMEPGLSLKWSNTAGDPNQPQATGISEPSAGVLSIDSTTVGNASGSLKLNNLTANGASVLASTTLNDMAYFDNTTGHLADSGILKGALVLNNQNNQYSGTQNYGTGSGQTQLTGTDFTCLNASLATTCTVHNLTGQAIFSLYATLTACSSTASPAVCAAAPGGKVQVAAAATSLVINTTAVTANSQIYLTYSTTGITAPANMSTLLLPYVSAVTAGTSFTITMPAAPTTNPVNVYYEIIN